MILDHTLLEILFFSYKKIIFRSHLFMLILFIFSKRSNVCVFSPLPFFFIKRSFIRSMYDDLQYDVSLTMACIDTKKIISRGDIFKYLTFSDADKQYAVAVKI